MFNIVLIEPEIPPNTGNIIRLAANTGCRLHLIGKLGFSMDDRQLRRAGLDYHEYAQVRRHLSWQAFVAQQTPDPQRLFALSSKSANCFYNVKFKAGDCLIFGPETRGLSAQFLARIPRQQQLRLPMQPHQRSLNLSNAVAVSVFEAWRQNAFALR